MAEVMSGKDLTVIVLTGEEASDLATLLHITRMNPAGLDEALMDRLWPLWCAL
jgi:hypothetical protein